jgi:glycosyltransferase involved in cell wall biosynthesis
MANLKKKRVSIVGTNGIPSQYGGFETLVEFLTKYLSNKFCFTVYCSKCQRSRIKEHNGAKLIYFPLKANGWQSLIYDIMTLLHAAFTSDVILYLGPGVGYFLPLIKLFNKNIIVNHGGLNEWERTKYNPIQRNVLKLGHKYGGKFASVNISDNFLLRESLQKTFGINSSVIRYGGNHAKACMPTKELINKYPFLNEKYYVNVSRAQVDNNLHVVLDAFRSNPELKLVMISNWNISTYGKNLKKQYLDNYSNIILLDAIYDSHILNNIRGNAMAYIHSHSYCGSSPSLIEAMCLGLPIFSFDVPTNRETTHDKAIFFSNSSELKQQMTKTTYEELLINKNAMKRIAEKHYTWEEITLQYEHVLSK